VVVGRPHGTAADIGGFIHHVRSDRSLGIGIEQEWPWDVDASALDKILTAAAEFDLEP
jgi:hypothetical protein